MSETLTETYTLRSARLDELPLLTQIELDAFVTFAEALCDTREPHALPQKVLRQSLEEGLLFVAVDPSDSPIAFLAGAQIDGSLYVTELDVSRLWQRKGVGTRLMLAAKETARASRLASVTLTTDRSVPFNAPFYQSLGFTLLDTETMPSFLQKKLDEETENGMDPERRVAMAWWLDASRAA